MLLTIDELSKQLIISKSTLYRWVHHKTIPFVKIGGNLRFLKTDIENYIRENSVSIS